MALDGAAIRLMIRQHARWLAMHSSSFGELQVAPDGDIELAHVHRSTGKQSVVHAVQCLKLILIAVE